MWCPTIPHHTLTLHWHWCCTWRSQWGFSTAQKCMLCTFTFPWFVKVTSSINNILPMKSCLWCRTHWLYSRRIWKSLSSSAWCRETCYGWNWCRWRMRSTLVWLIPSSLSILRELSWGFIATAARTATLAASFVTVLFRICFRELKFSVSQSLLTILVKVGRVGWLLSGKRSAYPVLLVWHFGNFPLKLIAYQPFLHLWKPFQMPRYYGQNQLKLC